MLIRFNVKNFLSFSSKENGTAEEFSMIAGKTENKNYRIYNNDTLKLIKFSAIYGANASGKSNLIKALRFMKMTIINGIPDCSTEKYYKLEEKNIDEPSYFELEIKLGDQYYAYGFEIILSQKTFTSEWLYELFPNNDQKILFQRNIIKSEYVFRGNLNKKGIKDKLKLYAEDINNDGSVLFLTIMNKNKKSFYEKYKAANILQEIYEWINNILDIHYPNEIRNEYSYLIDSKQINEVCQILHAFGTGITGFTLQETVLDTILREVSQKEKDSIKNILEQKIILLRNDPNRDSLVQIMRTVTDFCVIEIFKNKPIKCQKIVFSHGKKNIYFNLHEESDGTVRILDLLEILLTNNNKEKVYIIDELDRCLHPCLTYKFIELFLERSIQRNDQLIVTTNESRLLDFNILRKDEIWFINKSLDGQSHIYSLDEYNNRFDKKIDKAYLDGRYGGIPIFSNIFSIE